MTESNVLSMQFATQVGKSTTVSVRMPDPELTDEAVTAAMDRIIACGALSESIGELTERTGAYMTTTTTTEIDYLS